MAVYVLAVDGGGSSCTAVLLSTAGSVSVGEAGPCNVTSIGIDAALDVLATAIAAAVAAHEDFSAAHAPTPPLAAAWVALAGYEPDRPALATLGPAVAALLGLPRGPRLTLTSDIALLAVRAAAEQRARTAVVLVAGTGSVAMKFARDADDRFTRTARVGGWGALLGDEGSGFALGRVALQGALRARDRQCATEQTPALAAEVLRLLQVDSGISSSSLLSAILSPGPPPRRIARAAQAVLALAPTDAEARAILQHGAVRLADLVADIVLVGGGTDLASTALVTAGGVLRNRLYRDMVRQELSARGLTFGWILDVDSPALEGAQWLAQHVDIHMKEH